MLHSGRCWCWPVQGYCGNGKHLKHRTNGQWDKESIGRVFSVSKDPLYFWKKNGNGKQSCDLYTLIQNWFSFPKLSSRYVLNISEGFHDMGTVRWQIVLCLLLAWSLVCILMIKGIKSSGRVSILIKCPSMFSLSKVIVYFCPEIIFEILVEVTS